MTFHEILGDGRLENELADGKPLYTSSEARLEANRCLFCYDAPCIQACPTATLCIDCKTLDEMCERQVAK